MMARDMHLENCNESSPPGVKPQFDDGGEYEIIEDEPVQPVSSISSKKTTSGKRVRFNEDLEVHEIDVPCGLQYGFHPSEFVTTRRGWKHISPEADVFTGKRPAVMQARRDKSSTSTC